MHPCVWQSFLLVFSSHVHTLFLALKTIIVSLSLHMPWICLLDMFPSLDRRFSALIFALGQLSVCPALPGEGCYSRFYQKCPGPPPRSPQPRALDRSGHRRVSAARAELL